LQSNLITMSIKAKVLADFIIAMKEKNEVGKAALSGLKAKITEAEKANGNTELNDAEIIKVINTAVKQRKESADAFTKGNRHDLAIKELAELDVLNKYLPAQMTEAEIEAAVREIIPTLEGVATNPNVLSGKTMGAFNKQYPGRANAQVLKEVINRVIAA